MNIVEALSVSGFSGQFCNKNAIDKKEQVIDLKYEYFRFCVHIIYKRKLRMIDRLQQLRQLCEHQIQQSQPELSGSNAYLDKGEHQGIDGQFFEEIKSVREMIAVLRNNNQRIQSIKAKYAKAIKSQQEKENSRQMQEILSKNSQYYQAIAARLTELQSQVKRSQSQQPNQPQTKMKKNFYISLNKEASEVLKQQQNFQQQYKNTVKDKVIRQVRLIQRDITQQQLEQYVNNPDLAQQMLQRKIYGQASMTLKNTVNDIQDKFRDIQKLQHSVQQCVQLFNELAILVEAQGQQIDNIAANVADAKDYVQKGQKKLKEAKQHHKWSKKCLCWIAIGVTIVLVITVIIIVVATTAT